MKTTKLDMPLELFDPHRFERKFLELLDDVDLIEAKNILREELGGNHELSTKAGKVVSSAYDNSYGEPLMNTCGMAEIQTSDVLDPALFVGIVLYEMASTYHPRSLILNSRSICHLLDSLGIGPIVSRGYHGDYPLYTYFIPLSSLDKNFIPWDNVRDRMFPKKVKKVPTKKKVERT